MAPLAPHDVLRLLDSHIELTGAHRAVIAELELLRPTMAELRERLSVMHRRLHHHDP
jgi:hypothetical protein